MENFSQLGLPDTIVHALQKMNFTKPTPIQAQAIPLALSGKDVLGSAQTGTGKTAAYSIPLIANILAMPNSTALVLTPTRELAGQVIAIMNQLLGGNDVKSVLLIGGESIQRQLRELKTHPRPRIIVGTPGRVNDHLERGSLMLNKTNFFVLDETDKMLDMGFEIQIDRIAKYLPSHRQTLMFSATMPDNITKLANKYLNFPERITIGSVTSPIAKIKQEILYSTVEEKYNNLLTQINQRTGSIIVFVKTKRGADKLCDKLRKANHSADAIHGNLNQGKRDRVIASFRNRQHRIMVATDVAARGLDIPHIEHVINYDLPQVPEDYIHRIGRTGRNGAEGFALCIITPDDNKNWKAIDRMLNPNAKNDNQQRGGNSNKNNNGGGSKKSKRSFGGSNKEGRRFNDNAPRKEGERFSSSAPRKEGERGGENNRNYRFKGKSFGKEQPRREASGNR
jgi:superfamily II DNA/RNA helicase